MPKLSKKEISSGIMQLLKLLCSCGIWLGVDISLIKGLNIPVKWSTSIILIGSFVLAYIALQIVPKRFGHLFRKKTARQRKEEAMRKAFYSQLRAEMNDYERRKQGMGKRSPGPHR